MTNFHQLVSVTDEALLALFDALSDHAWGGGLTCNEADALVDLYRMWGYPVLAQQLYNGHVQSDSPGDRHCDDLAEILNSIHVKEG